MEKTIRKTLNSLHRYYPHQVHRVSSQHILTYIGYAPLSTHIFMTKVVKFSKFAKFTLDVARNLRKSTENNVWSNGLLTKKQMPDIKVSVLY